MRRGEERRGEEIRGEKRRREEKRQDKRSQEEREVEERRGDMLSVNYFLKPYTASTSSRSIPLILLKLKYTTHPHTYSYIHSLL